VILNRQILLGVKDAIGRGYDLRGEPPQVFVKEYSHLGRSLLHAEPGHPRRARGGTDAQPPMQVAKHRIRWSTRSYPHLRERV